MFRSGMESEVLSTGPAPSHACCALSQASIRAGHGSCRRARKKARENPSARRTHSGTEQTGVFPLCAMVKFSRVFHCALK